MGVYLGYQTFRRLGGVLRVTSLVERESALSKAHKSEVQIFGWVFPEHYGEGNVRPVILINEKYENQAHTIIHELLHLGVEGEKFFKPAEGEYLRSLPEIERKVEELTDQVYNCQPRFVEHIIQRFLTRH